MDFEMSSEGLLPPEDVATPGPVHPRPGPVHVREPEKEIDLGTTLFCNQCGQPNPRDSRFCNKCGSRITVLSSTDRTIPDTSDTSHTADTTGNTDTSTETSGKERTARQVQIPPESNEESPGVHPPDDSASPSSEPGAARQVGIIVGAG